MTDQGRITEVDQRIVDLEIGQMFDAASLRIIQTSVALQRRDGAAMPVGTECQGILSPLTAILPVFASTAGIVPCLKMRTFSAGSPR